ncbi:aminotransferase-like domain-containing protein [Sporolactobacillus putidus]|uniref:Aminotransferase n=1 Tax=Sporolactobacillus putidus TaxID=492735 RepID=A0A917W1L4_9BACL|nr:PLP-dependent aminotransferase family protein [Sporolactobacillus putidus]GGL56832.1 aminotransferase [Sporolactobacillus putidus]
MSQTGTSVFPKRFVHVNTVGSALGGGRKVSIPLAYGYPAPETFPIAELSEATVSALQESGPEMLQYSGGSGQQKIVEWIRNRSRLRSIYAEEKNILVTSGSNQGIDLAARALAEPGDEVWVEAPTYFGGIRAIQLAGASLRAFPIDSQGLCVDLVEEALMKAKKDNGKIPKFIYILPNYQNPGGTALSLERRKKLAELAYHYNFYIVEDDAYVELNFTGHTLPSIYSFAPDRVIYLSTFSKIVAPGIRCAWMIAYEEILKRAKILKSDGLTSVFVQETISCLLEKMNFDKHVQKLIACYCSRKDAMVQAIHNDFQDEVSFNEPAGGFFLWLTFPSFIDTSYMLEKAYKKSVNFIPGNAFFLNKTTSSHLRLAFSSCDEESINRGIERLAEIYFKMRNSL